MGVLVILAMGCATARAPARDGAPGASSAVAPRAPAQEAWRFAVISDVHVTAKGGVPPAFTRLVAKLVELRPKLVVVTGDSTSGNPKDGFGRETVRMWWRKFREALAPLRAAGIPVFPVAGNHDFYRPVHREAYLGAWAELAAEVAPFELSGSPPLNYSTTVGGTRLLFLNIVDQRVEPGTEKQIHADANAATDGAPRLRFAFGHVPLFSIMGHTSESFMGRLGGLLVADGVSAYFCGHEHLVWDETREIAAGRIRQVMAGTASATYTYGLKPLVYEKNCTGEFCRMPEGGRVFTVAKADRKELKRQAFILVSVSDAGYTAEPLALDAAGAVVPFYDGE